MREHRLPIFVGFKIVVIATMLTAFSKSAFSDALDLLENDINAWRVEDARTRLEKLSKDTRSLPRALYLKGQLLFFEGELDAALDALRRAVEGNRTEPTWKALRDRTEQTKRFFDPLTRQLGASNRFVYRFSSNTDRLLIPYADETLTRQLDVLSKLLGDSPKRPVEVVFVQSSEALAAASGLPVEQIERTGTVGVAKYARIMIVTPRNLVSGYPWLDTLAHELTHYVITRASLDRVPIWLHEGIAKLLECRHGRDEVQDLSPEEAYLLDRAVKERRLIPLRRFHPSVAYLPDQEEAALAYAQALSFLRYLNERMSDDWLKRLLAGLAHGSPLDAMLKSLSGADLRTLYKRWKKSAAGKRHTPPPAVSMMRKRFKQGVLSAEGSSDSLHLPEVRKYLRLGDLLRLRGHINGAVKEFEKARKLARFASPEISDRLGASLLEIGEYERARDLLVPVTKLYPFHATGFVQLARAYVGLREAEKSVDALKNANAVNPFDPEVHCMAANLLREIGDTQASVLEAESCRAATAVQKQSEEN